jgi:hypothetical protein
MGVVSARIAESWGSGDFIIIALRDCQLVIGDSIRGYHTFGSRSSSSSHSRMRTELTQEEVTYVRARNGLTAKCLEMGVEWGNTSRL